MKKLIILFIAVFMACVINAQTMKIEKEIKNVTVDIVLSDNANINYKDSVIYFDYKMVIYLKDKKIAETYNNIEVPMIGNDYKALFWAAIKQELELNEGEYIIE